MNDQAIKELLGDLAGEPISGALTREFASPIAIWLPNEAKARYDALQDKSRRAFGKRVREILLALIAAAEARAT